MFRHRVADVNRRRFLRVGVPVGCGLAGVAGVAQTTVRVDRVEFETTYDRPHAPWALCLAGVIDPDRLGRPEATTSLSSLPAFVAELLRSATRLGDRHAESDHRDAVVDSEGRRRDAVVDGEGWRRDVGFESEPTRLREHLADVVWVDGFDDDHLRAFAVLPTGADDLPPMAAEATAAGEIGAPASPVTFTLTARNRGDRPLAVFSGVRPPFGPVTLDGVDERSADWIPLFAPDEPLGHLPPFRSLGVATPLLHDRYEPGETETRRYQLRAMERTVRPGRYEATGEFTFGVLVPPAPAPDDNTIPTAPRPGVWAVEWTLTVELTESW
jgi:hypothetical protein